MLLRFNKWENLHEARVLASWRRINQLIENKDVNERASNTYLYAQEELERLCREVPDSIVAGFKDEILSLVNKFGNSGQSGGSAPFTMRAITDTLSKLMMFEPISPVMGDTNEWTSVAQWCDREMYQNNRCSAVFKDSPDSRAYYIDSIIWKEADGGCYSGSALLKEGDALKRLRSKNWIKDFPFDPRKFYIDVISEEVAPDDWEFYVKDPAQLEEVWKYYDPYQD